MNYLAPLFICVATLGAAVLAAPPPADADAVAAVFPPWWGRERAMHAAADAGALVLQQGALASILVVRSGTGSPAGRLRDQGAVLVLGASGLTGCLSRS